MSIQALRERRASVALNLRNLMDESKDRRWESRDQEKYDTGMREIEDIDGQIKRIEAVLALNAERNVGSLSAGEARELERDKLSPKALFNTWLRKGDSGLTAEQWAHIRNTMSTTTNGEGGYTVQTEVAATILDALKAYGGMRAAADVMRTANGSPMNFPTSDGTSEVGEILAENAGATSADVSFGVKSLPVYKYSSKVVTVPIELLQDSQADVEAFVRGRLTTRLGRITNTHFTTGDASSKPNGVVNAVTFTQESNSTSQVTTYTYATLIKTIHSVDPAYRQGGQCRWMMNDGLLSALRQIVDGQSRPIFIPGYQNAGIAAAAGADTLLGYPIVINQDVATPAANAKSLLFGDFSYYKIRDCMDITFFRFTDSAFAKYGQVGFLAFLRSGGNFVDVGGAIKGRQNAAS